MRRFLCVLSVLLLAVFICGTASFATPFTQKGYNVNIEYYFVQDDMFMYLHDKDNNLLAVGLDNEGCLVYGQWDLETGGVKQVLDENGEEYVVGVRAAPPASAVFPIPEIAYKLAEDRRAAYDKANQVEEIEPAADAITFEEYKILEAVANEEGAAFTPAYIQEKQAQLEAQGASISSLATASMSAMSTSGKMHLDGYPLYDVLPTIVDEYANPWPGGTATSPRGGKVQKTWMAYVMFEGASQLKEGAIQLAPSYFNDAMFSNEEWRPYVDERYLRGEIAYPDRFSINFALMTGNRLRSAVDVSNDVNIVSMDSYAAYNAVSDDREEIRRIFLSATDTMTNQARNLYAFEHGIYHGSTSHALWYGFGKRYALEAAIENSQGTNRGGIVAVTVAESLNGPIDNANVQGSFGVSGIPTNLTPLRDAAAREFVKKVDVRQFGTYSASNNTWSVSQAQVSGGLIMTGYSWEFSAEKCVLGRLPGLWGQSAGSVTVSAANTPPEYNGAAASMSFFVVTSHCLDEGRKGEGTEAVLEYWPTRPRQHVVYEHELSHSTLSITDTYDVGAQNRDLGGASYRYPRYLNENILSNGNIDVVNIPQVQPFPGGPDDPRNWMPGTRYTAAFGNWGPQGICGYVGASNEDLAARGGIHDGFNAVDLSRVIKPKVLTENGTYTLKLGDIMMIKAGSASPADGSFMGSGSGHQAFYLSVHEDRMYDQAAFDWARDKLIALKSDAGFEGNLTGDNRFSIRNRLAGGVTIPPYLLPYRTGNANASETAFADAKGGLLITHVDTYRAQSSSTGANATAAYGLHVVNAEAHAYPSGIYTLGVDAPTYPDIHIWGNDYYNDSADVKLLDGKVVVMDGKSASKDSHPATQHMIERFSTDRARGENISYDVRVNAADPADLFHQWGVDEFKNPRLFTGESRISFNNSGNLTPAVVWARSQDVRLAHERQRRATGAVVPFAITNIRFFAYDDVDNPVSPDKMACVTFDFEITVPPTDVSIQLVESMDVSIGQTRTLTATVSPDTYPGDRTIAWTSSRTDVATVSNTGLVTPVAPGYVVITAALSEDRTIFAECAVTVPVNVTGVTVSPTSTTINMKSASTAILTATVSPVAAVNKSITWSSNNTAVATVAASGDNQCVVTAVGPGAATITVTTVDGSRTATCAVTVATNVTGITVSPGAITLAIGGTHQFTGAVIPANATQQLITWGTDNAAVATVNASTGLVTAVGIGTTTIYGMTGDGGFTARGAVSVFNVTAEATLTTNERKAIHNTVDNLSGDVGNVYDLAKIDPNSLIGALLYGAAFDSISRGSGGVTPTAYPFPVTSNSSNQNEGARKSAKSAWVEQLAKNLGFSVVVRRQPDKLVWVEIGDSDAPEMVMALSHLDSPTASVQPAQHARWRGPDLKIGAASAYYEIAYKSPYIHEGWLYGAGAQDDSGPTLATLLAAKALMDTGLPMDRRIRILMGIYEDGGPGTPSVANTINYMNIPFYTSNSSFYDNWVYKALNREEMPIAAFTSDSRFPVIVGNSYAATPAISMNLSADVTGAKPFRLVSAQMGITERSGDVTLKDIVYGSTTQVPSKAIFTIDVSGVSPAAEDRFISDLKAAAAAQGWSTVSGAELAKVDVAISADTVVITINTDVAMEMPTPQYGKNAIVWGMYLLSDALGKAGVASSDLQLKKAADGIADLFFREGAKSESEGDAYLGKYMGIPANLLRNPDNGSPNFTLALGAGINNEVPVSFYTASTGVLSINVYLRGMHLNSADHTAAANSVTNAWQGKGFSIGSLTPTGGTSFASEDLAETTGAGPTLYLSHKNPLTALQFASYKATMNADPAAFDDVYHLIGVSYPQGTTGGTLATGYLNKMNAFGATIPGNERWWHTANERIKTKSIVQMTKLFADGLIEMARYSGPAGAKVMWADIPGLNPDRADLDLLDVTIGTYKDASSAVTSAHLNGATLLGATAFDIPMWAQRGNATYAQIVYDRGHAAGGIYLPPDSIPANDTYVLPMRLEFKVSKPASVTDSEWQSILAADINDIAPLLSFNILNGGAVVHLTLPAGEKPDMFFYKRVSRYDPNTLYVSVNLAIKDAAYDGVTTVVADSKTDLYELNPNYLAANPDPFPERGKKEKRGFFVFGDNAKDARFTSPSAVFVALENIGISLNEVNISLDIGNTTTLVATVVPDTANKNVKWTSSNPSVATVLGTSPFAAQGIVTAIAGGTATITVSSITDPTKTAQCVVYVPTRVTSVSVSPTSMDLNAGSSANITVNVSPSSADNKAVTWRSDNTAVATVDQNGRVTAVGNGSANVSVTTSDGGFTATCIVRVTTSVTGVTVAPTQVSLVERDTLQLTETVAPGTASNKNVTWSSNSSSATVSSSGLVTAVSEGSATITVRTVDGGLTASCYVTVTSATINVTGVTISPTSLTLEMGKTYLLNEDVSPASATDPSVSWTSNNTAVATVSAGLVTAQSIGTAKITVRTNDGGFEAECSVNVTPIDVTQNYPSDKNEVADNTGIAANDLEEKDGKVFLKNKAAEAVAKALYNWKNADVSTHPTFTAAVVPDGGVAKVTITATGKDLLALFPEDVILIGMISGTEGAAFEYVNDVADFDANKFTILLGGLIYGGEIDPDEIYEIVFFIEDGGLFDLDNLVNGELISSVFFAAEKAKKGGGGGCNAYEYFALALFGIAPFVLRRK